MALSKKITELDSLGSPAGSDLLAVVDMSGDPVTKQATITDVLAAGGGGGGGGGLLGFSDRTNTTAYTSTGSWVVLNTFLAVTFDSPPSAPFGLVVFHLTAFGEPTDPTLVAELMFGVYSVVTSGVVAHRLAASNFFGGGGPDSGDKRSMSVDIPLETSPGDDPQEYRFAIKHNAIDVGASWNLYGNSSEPISGPTMSVIAGG